MDMAQQMELRQQAMRPVNVTRLTIDAANHHASICCATSAHGSGSQRCVLGAGGFDAQQCSDFGSKRPMLMW